MNISKEQFRKIFPFCPNPSAVNGYGWSGNGFGWQLEPFSGTGAGVKKKSERPGLKVTTYDEPMAILDEAAVTLLFKEEHQNFVELRNSNFHKKILFEDLNFPAQITSLRYNPRNEHWDDVIWLRPKEITPNPKLFMEGHSRLEVIQGAISNCWFVASVACLAMHKNLLRQVIPEDQSFDEKYAGIFHFRFWQHGKWIDVFVDDRLPTRNKKLISMHSNDDSEFWSALLEKAYAKLHGSYEALINDRCIEAMQDLTGGIVEIFSITESLPDISVALAKALERNSLMLCAIDDNIVKKNAENSGLDKGHIYTITNATNLKIPKGDNKGETVLLLRMRNPWGDQNDWNGAWSDNSKEWQDIPEDLQKEIGFLNKSEGEFWMTYNDFKNIFSVLEICSLSLDSLSEGADKKKKWEGSEFEGGWVCKLSAGGAWDKLALFAHNPQYLILLTEPDEGNKDGKCTLIVSLTQKHRRAMKFKGAKLKSIGFVLYLLPETDNNLPKPLTLDFFQNNEFVAGVPSYVNLHSVTCRFELPRGTYCIIPSAQTPGEEGSFMLRVCGENKINMEEYDNSIEFRELDEMINNRMFISTEQEIDERTIQMFLKLSGENLDITWLEFKEIVDSAMKQETKQKGFTEEVCRSIVALSDKDHSGKLDYEEFKDLWIDIIALRDAFKLHDVANSGTLSGHEVRETLKSAGCSLNFHILMDLVHRYGNKQCQLNFENFILCALKAKVMIELFNSKKEASEIAEFSLEEWLQATFYC